MFESENKEFSCGHNECEVLMSHAGGDSLYYVMWAFVNVGMEPNKLSNKKGFKKFHKPTKP